MKKRLIVVFTPFLLVFVFSCQDNRPTVPVSELDDSLSEGKVDDDVYPVDKNNDFENESDLTDTENDSEWNEAETDSDMENPDSDEVETEKVFTRLAVGSSQTCAVNEAGSVYCWGSNNLGSLGKKDVAVARVPMKLDIDDEIVSVSCGDNHCYALSRIGTFYIWGDNSYGQLGKKKQYTVDFVEIPEKTTIQGGIVSVRSLIAGSDNTFVIDLDGKLYGWGVNYTGQIGDGTKEDGTKEERFVPVEIDMAGVMKDSSVVSVSPGGDHTCAVDSVGKVYCWGENESGQLGDGTVESSLVPVEVDMTGDLSGKTVVTVSAGLRYTCVLDIDGNVYCWGSLLDSVISSPSKVALKNPAVSISVNNSSACVLDEAGKIWCWGNNGEGQLGNLSSEDSSVPVEVYADGVLKDRKIIEVRTGLNHSCALDDTGKIFCWGDNRGGQIGNGKSSEVYGIGGSVPKEVVTESGLKDTKVSFIACSFRKTFAVDEQGSSYFWGKSGLEALEYNNIPVLLGSENSFNENSIISLDSGEMHACILYSDSNIYCWGSNLRGQLGNNSKDSSDTPVKVDISGVLKGKTITMLSAGEYHNCVLDDKGKVYCWGSNESRQLGYGSVPSSSVPVEVDMTGDLNGKKVTSVQCGSTHTCALDSDGLAYCWGQNDYTQLGVANTTQSNVPIKVYSEVALKDKKLVLLGSGNNHNCAVDDTNAIYCWGANGSGQMGIGYKTRSQMPAKTDQSGVLKNKKIKSIYCGGETTCVLDEEGKAYCWGAITGNKIDEESSVPVSVYTDGVLKGKELVSISIGYDQVCAIDSDGLSYCWGSNKYGQIGSGFNSVSNVPKEVFRSMSE